jgi:hypothetical protein
MNWHKLSRFTPLVWTFVSLCALTLLAWSPFLRGDMLMTDDGNLHLYRTIVLDYTLAHDGYAYPRYASALAYGYGAPLFNYFSPLSYLLPVGLARLGLPYVTAWQVGMCAYLFVAAWGAWRIGRRWGGDAGGLLAGASYLYAPYLLFDAVTRGTITEVAGLALLPHVLASLEALAERTTWRAWAGACLTFALFVPLHNIVTLHGSLLIGAYSLFLAWRAPTAWRALAVLASVGAVGLAMSAFFWLPSLAEARFVKIEAISQALPFLDVTRHLRPLHEAFALWHTADNSRLQLPVPITYSVAQVGLAVVLGAFALLRRERRGVWLFWAGVVGVTAFMNTPASAPLWERVPLFGYTQYAWRVLGVGSLALAVLIGVGAGAVFASNAPRRHENALLGVFIGVIVLSSMGYLFRPTTGVIARDVRDAQDYERATGEVALSSFSEYLPIWNEGTSTLDPEGLRAGWANAPAVPRLLAQDGVSVTSEAWGGLWGDVSVTSASERVLTFAWLYTPNWRASVNGRDVPTEAVTPQGFVGVRVPNGASEVRVFWAETPLQTGANVVSLLAVLGVLGVWGAQVWQSRSALSTPTGLMHQDKPLGFFVGDVVPHSPLQRVTDPLNPLKEGHGNSGDSGVERLQNLSSTPTGRPQRASMAVAVIVGVLAFGLRVGVLDANDTPFHTAHLKPDGTFTRDGTRLDVSFSNGITLISADVPAQVQAGETFALSAYYRLTGDLISTDESARYDLLNGDGVRVASASLPLIGHLPTSAWQAGFYVADEVAFAVPQTLPPDTYALEVTLFNPQTQAIASALNAQGNPQGASARLGTLTLLRPSKPAPMPDTAVRADKNADLYFVSLEGLPEQMTAGDELNLVWEWHTTSALAQEPFARLLWLRDGSARTATAYHALARGGADVWQAGDTWRGHPRLYVPATIEAGRYLIGVQLGRSLTPIWLYEVEVSVPERTFATPMTQVPVNATWANGLRLLGYDVGDGTLTLYWTTTRLQSQSLRRFVHVVDASGRILAQADGVPKDWARPITGWLVNEVITETLPLTAPDGTAWAIGWYDPRDGKRVRVGEREVWTVE